MARKDVVQIRVSELEKDRWREAAAEQHMELSQWIRLVLDRATRPGAPPITGGHQPTLDDE